MTLQIRAPVNSQPIPLGAILKIVIEVVMVFSGVKTGLKLLMVVNLIVIVLLISVEMTFLGTFSFRLRLRVTRFIRRRRNPSFHPGVVLIYFYFRLGVPYLT